MPASAISVVAKLATNPATAQTVPKSPRNLRPLREKKHRALPNSTQRAQRTQNIAKYRNKKDSTEYLRVICGLCVKQSTEPFPIPHRERKERRVQYISYHASLCVKKYTHLPHTKQENWQKHSSFFNFVPAFNTNAT